MNSAVSGGGTDCRWRDYAGSSSASGGWNGCAGAGLLTFCRCSVDFWEAFADSAKVLARTVGLTLTSRDKGTGALAMAGFPYYHLDAYVGELVQEGYRVALLERAA